MRRSNLKKVFSATLAAVLVLGAAACGQEKTKKTEETTTVADSAASKPEGSGGSETADPYYIAWAAPLTGDNANAGQEGLTALNMAIDEFNAAGGYEGHKIVVDTFDDKNDPTEAANIAQQIVSDKKYMAVLGSFASGATMAGAPIYENNIVQLSPTASSTKIPEVGGWTWMMCPDAVFQYSSWARIAVQELNAKTIGMIVIDGDNGALILDTVTKAAKEYGGEVIADDKFIQGQTKDFTSLLQKVNKDNPDAIGIFCSYADSSAICMQARELGIKAKLILSPDSYNKFLLEAFGDFDTTDIYVSSMMTPDSKIETVHAFNEMFYNANGYYPGLMGSGAYECGNMVIRAIKDGATDRESFHEIISGYTTTEGKVFNDSIDENRKVSRQEFFISKIVDGKYECMN